MARLLTISSFILILLSVLSAQNNFTLDSELRYRFQADGKDFNNDTKSVNYNELRSRLGLTLIPEENITVYLQVQDARLFGEETNTLTDGSADNLDMHQAYVRLNKIFASPFSLQLGRFEAAYGNERLIGAVGWHNIGRSFDGMIIKYKNEMVEADLFHLKEAEFKIVGDTMDKNVSGVYAKIKAAEKLNVQVFSILQRTIGDDQLSRLTIGAVVRGQFDPFWAEGEFALQNGRIDSVTDISAMMFAVNGGVKFSGTYMPWLSAGLDYLSGDDDPTDGESQVFNTLYATNHKFYGFMDFFTDIPTHTNKLGLQDIHLKAGMSLTKTLSGDIAVHQFNSSEKSGSKSNFGHEADFTFKYQYSPSTAVIAGASLFMPGEMYAGNADNSTWFYLMTVVKL